MMEFDWFRIEAALFDLDGVLTPTARVHEAAWKRAFDAFLADRLGPDFDPFTEDDYLAHVDGKPRYNGVADFLVSRSIELPRGEPSDAPGHDTVCALGNLKNDMFNRVLSDEGVDPYPDAVRLLDWLGTTTTTLVVVSSSANAKAVLEAAGLADRFSFVMDGVEARKRGLPGKPAPDTFVDAAIEVGGTASTSAVFEDAVSGVAADAAGGFAAVIGVDRIGSSESLRTAGATIVVEDLSSLIPGS